MIPDSYFFLREQVKPPTLLSMRFLVHGSIAYDLLLGYDGSFIDAIDAKHLDALSVSYFSPRFKRHHGGTAANIAWNLKILGQDPLIVGAVGTDGAPYCELLEEYGIETSMIDRRSDAITATAIIGTDSHEHQIAFFHPGADVLHVNPDHDAFDDIAYAIISPRSSVHMLDAAKKCHESGIQYLFDPGQQSHIFSRDEFRRAIKGSTGLIVNTYEWALASEKLEWSTDAVIDACGLLVVTHGEEGVTLTSKEGAVIVPASKAEKVLNPTGAGDAFRAGLLTGLAADWSLADSGRLGAVMGSFVVEYDGTLLPHLKIEDVSSRYLESYGDKMPNVNDRYSDSNT